jgi:hypothetical protein
VADLVMALPPGVPARAETLRNATEVDRFCADVDIQIGVNVVARERPFEGREIERLAGRHALMLLDDGSFHAPGGDGATLFYISSRGFRCYDVSTFDGRTRSTCLRS